MSGMTSEVVVHGENGREDAQRYHDHSEQEVFED